MAATMKQIVDGYHVMKWLGGRYGSIAWFHNQTEANKEVQRILMLGAWSGMPPTVQPSFKEYNP